MTYVPGYGELPWEQALLVASEDKPWPWDNLAKPAGGAEAESVYLHGSDLLFSYPGGVVKPAPGVHLFGKPVHHRDHGDGTGTLFTDGDVPQNGSVEITFSPAVGPNGPPDPSVSQIFGPYDDLHDQLGITAFANYEIRFGVTIRTAAIVFNSETARDEFNYGFDLTTWTLGGVSLKTEYDPGNTGWSHSRFTLNGVSEYSIQLVDPPADPTIVDLFSPSASHLLEWDNA